MEAEPSQAQPNTKRCPAPRVIGIIIQIIALLQIAPLFPLRLNLTCNSQRLIRESLPTRKREKMSFVCCLLYFFSLTIRDTPGLPL
ncbi:hypothetical protein V8C34DRAFT_227932 [Trichoderma compactum]